MPIEEPEIEKPKYLSSVSMDLADAAAEAVRNETVRLYDISVEVITNGLSIDSEIFQAEKKAKRVVKQSQEIIDRDIDDLYERKIKALYGAIVEFIVHTRAGYSKGLLREEMSALRGAGQNIVEAVKGVKHLRKNLNRFMQSDNEYISKEYDKLRFMIIRVLKKIDESRKITESDPSVMSLDLDPL